MGVWMSQRLKEVPILQYQHDIQRHEQSTIQDSLQSCLKLFFDILYRILMRGWINLYYVR